MTLIPNTAGFAFLNFFMFPPFRRPMAAQVPFHFFQKFAFSLF